MTVSLRHRWMPIALLASLGANLFLGGYVAARHNGGPPRPPGGPDRFIEDVARTLSPDDAAILRRSVDQHRGDFTEEHQRRDSFPQKIQAVLQKDPFDPEALAEVFAANDREEQAFRQRLQKAMIEAAAAMSADGRHRLAQFRPERRGPPPERP